MSTGLPSLTRRTRIALIAAASALVLLSGGGIAVASVAGAATDAAEIRSVASDGEAEPDAVDTGAAGGLQDPAAPAPATIRTAATATRVEIPSIGVDSGLEQLDLDTRTGVLDPPDAWLSAGWYADGTVPGDVGPAVIAGHVDSRTAPAVFARLGELVAGDRITVTLSDGSTREFAVDSATSAPKDAFPTAQVYGPTPSAQLRLITCDGAFDNRSGHYVDNLIVFASLVP